MVACATGYVRPPGACCAICAAAMRVVYSRKQIDRSLYGLSSRQQHLVTLQMGVLDALQRLIGTAGCRVSGYLTMEADVFVAVHSGSPGASASAAAATACARELEKLATLIRTQAVQVVSDVALSALIGAQIVEPMEGGPAYATGAAGRPLVAATGSSVAWRLQVLGLVMLWGMWWWC